jgi:hypothetical protein
MPTTIDIAYFNSFYIKSSKGSETWHIEESRIKGGFNEVSVDLGVKAYIIDESFEEERRKNALIYSGVFNSRTAINNTNQFSMAEPITKSVNSANGSIQKLFAEETNLIVFQEDKVSKALIDKDAIFNAEGGGAVTSSNVVIGQIVPFTGRYGISKNPESFAVYGSRKYFSDKNRGVVLRLSSGAGGGDGITPISDYGMRSFFRDKLKTATRIVGSFDAHHQSYIISVQTGPSFETISFSDNINGWTSRHSYKPYQGFSLTNNFYTFSGNNIWKHYDKVGGITYGQYYGSNTNESSVTFSVNQNSVEENIFYNISYEGTPKWALKYIKTNTDDRDSNGVDDYYLDSAEDIANSETTVSNVYINASIFNKRGNRYFADFQNNSPGIEGEVYDADISSNLGVTGVKGNFLKATFCLPTNETITKKEELFGTVTNFNKITI